MPPRIIRIGRDGRVENQDCRVKLSKSGQNGRPQEGLWLDTQNGGPWTITFARKASAAPIASIAKRQPFPARVGSLHSLERSERKQRTRRDGRSRE